MKWGTARDPIALFEAKVTVCPFYEGNDIRVCDNHVNRICTGSLSPLE
jgi:hypothetical protein